MDFSLTCLLRLIVQCALYMTKVWNWSIWCWKESQQNMIWAGWAHIWVLRLTTSLNPWSLRPLQEATATWQPHRSSLYYPTSEELKFQQLTSYTSAKAVMFLSKLQNTSPGQLKSSPILLATRRGPVCGIIWGRNKADTTVIHHLFACIVVASSQLHVNCPNWQ